MSDLEELKEVLFKIGKRVPLHITYMHVEEEREFNFITGQGAVKLNKLWPKNRHHSTHKCCTPEF